MALNEALAALARHPSEPWWAPEVVLLLLRLEGRSLFLPARSLVTVLNRFSGSDFVYSTGL